MRRKRGMYRKSLLISYLYLLIFGQMSLAELKIYYMQGFGAVPFWEWSLWVMDADGGNKRVFLKPPVPITAPDLSPDGKQILFTTLPRDHDVWGIPKYKLMVMNLDGSELREFLANPPHPGSLVGKWSPDGKRVLYLSFKPERPIKFELFVTDAQGLNSFQVASNLENLGSPQWFPDSQRIAFSILKPGGGLYRVDTDANAKAEPMAIKLFEASQISWSRDGKRTIIAGRTNAQERNDLFLGDAMGRNLIRLTQDADDQSGVAWLPDGKHIIYGTDSERPDVAVMNVVTKEIRRLTDDGQSAFAFWYDPTLGVEAAGKGMTFWGVIKTNP